MAVILVMLFHLRVPGFAMGWAGVPLFFALSGFLITHQLDTGMAPGKFYWRRATRIVPALYLYLAVNMIVCAAFGAGADRWGAYFMNFLFLSNEAVTQAGPPVGEGYTGHLWSVAVEAQFYAIWPLAFALLRRRMIWVALALLVLAPLWRVVQPHPYAAMMTLGACLDLFAAGAIVALNRDWRIAAAMAAGGVLLIAASLPHAGNTAEAAQWVSKAPWLYSGLAMLFASAVSLAARAPPRALQWAPLLYVGKISYGLYLWQMLAFIAAERAGAPLARRAFGLRHCRAVLALCRSTASCHQAARLGQIQHRRDGRSQFRIDRRAAGGSGDRRRDRRQRGKTDIEKAGSSPRQASRCAMAHRARMRPEPA